MTEERKRMGRRGGRDRGQSRRGDGAGRLPLLARVLFTAASLFFAVMAGGCASKAVKAPPGAPPSKAATPAAPATRSGPTQRPYTINGRTYYPIPSAYGYKEEGVASWYGRDFHGKSTSNGETYDMYAETAAHKILPMNTWLLVENLDNGRQLTVRVNDRGPFVKERIIDLTYTGAQKLGMLDCGTARVRVTALAEEQTVAKDGGGTEKVLSYPDLYRGEFYVQIGAFEVRDNAERLKDRMIREGRSAVVQTFDRGDKTFHRVQVRAGDTMEEASRAERQMSAAGFPGAFVVAR